MVTAGKKTSLTRNGDDHLKTTITFLTLLLALTTACQQRKSLESNQKRSIDDESVSILVLANDWRMTSIENSKIVACIWDDGYSVWSNDLIVGGPPFRKGQIDTADVESIKHWMIKSGYLKMPHLRKDNLGPDSEFISLKIKNQDGDSDFEMCSWHENWEAKGRFVDLTEGPELIDKGKTRFEELSNESMQYLLYRIAWSEFRIKILDLHPSVTWPVDGSIDESNPKNRIWIEKETTGK